MDVGDALVHALLVEVGHEDRHLERADEEHRQLAGHEAGADDADLADRAGERLVGGAGRSLRALLHEVEGVQPGAQLVTHEQVGQGLVLGGEGGIALGGARGLDELDGAVGRRGLSCGLRVGELRGGRGSGLPHGGVVVHRLALDLRLAGEHTGGPDDRLLEEVGAVEERVGEAELRRGRAVQHPVGVERVLDDDLEGLLRADEAGSR